MVSSEPAKKDTTKPPTMAVKTPMIGGKLEAPAIPRQRGRAIKETRNPERRSDFQ